MTDLSGRKFGKYELIEQLGRGGMAEVYKAYQPGMNRFVAVKVLHGHLAGSEDFVERFKREAQSVGQLRHPNILQVFDFDVEQNVYYMVMEYIEGDTLKAYIRQRGALPVAEALRLAELLADALDYAHKKHMVHRDIKPANVMFTDKDHSNPVLTDFGIARLLGDAGLTVSGAFVGTPAYMSPESGRGEKVDERADIYSLGIMLYEMLTGKVPFDADTPFAVVMKHVNEPLPSMRGVIRDLPPEVELVLLKSLAKDPQERFQTATDFKVALQKARENLGQMVDSDSTSIGAMASFGEKQTVVDERWNSTASQSARGTTPLMESGRKPVPYTLIAAGVGAVILVLVLAAVILGGGGDDTDDATESDTTSAAVADVTETDIPTLAPEDTPAVDTEPTIGTITPEDSPTDAPTDAPTVVAIDEVQALLDEGRGHLTNGDYEQAIVSFESAVERDSNRAESYAYLGRAYFFSGQFDAALTNLSTAVSMDSSISLAYLDRGKVYLHFEQWAEAVDDFTTVLGFSPLPPVEAEALAWRGFGYFQLGDREAAATDLNAALALEPSNADALLNRARLSLSDGEFEAALNDLNRAIDNGASSALVYFIRGQALQANGDSEGAIRDYTQTIEINSAFVMAYFQRGKLSYDAGSYEAALRDFNMVVSLDPENREVYPLRAEIYMAEAAWPEAIDDYSIALQYEPDNFDYRNQRGWARLQVGNSEQALRDFNRVLELDANNTDALTKRGFTYMVTGDLDAALADINRAIELAPELAWPYEVRAYIWFYREDFDAAVVDAQQALALDDSALDALVVLGRVARVKGNFEEALGYINHYIERDATNPDVLGDRGAVYIALGRYEEALADLNQAISLNSEISYLYADRGVAHTELGNWDAALSDLDVALNSDPLSPYLLSYRSRVYIDMGRIDEALVDIDTWLGVEPENTEALTSRAVVNFLQGNYDQSLADADTAIGIDGGSAWTYLVRGWALMVTENYDGALGAFDEAIARAPGLVEAYRSRGQIYQLQGNLEQALASYQEAINQGDQSAEVYVSVAQVHQATGNDAEAEAVLQQAVASGYVDATTYFELGNLYDRQGRPDEALNAYQEYVRLAGDDANEEIVARVGEQVPPQPATININTRFMPYLPTDDPAVIAAANEVDQLLNTEGAESALALINRHFTDFPNDPILLSLRSDIYRELGRNEESLQEAQAAIDGNPEHPVGYLAVSRYYFFVEYDGEQAFTFVQQAYDLTPEQPEVLLHYAVGLDWNNRYEEAIEYYDRAEAAGAPLTNVLWERAEVLMRVHQYERAAADYVRFVEEVSNYYEARYFAVGAYMLAGNHEAALNMIREGVIAYDTPDFYSRASYVAYRVGDYELAAEWANTALAFDGDQIAASYTLALLATAQGDYETALSILLPIRDIETWRYEYPYLNLQYGHSVPLDIARVYMAQSDKENTLLYLNEAVAVDWYGLVAHVERGNWFWEQGDQDRALQDYLAAINEVFYEDPINASEVMQKVIDLDYSVMLEAANYFVWDYEQDMLSSFVDLGLKAHPDDPWLLLYRARVFLMQEDYETALSEIQQLQQLATDHPAPYVGLSEYFYRQDQREEMLSAAEEANARGADNPEVQLNYVRALWVNDRDEEAIPLFKAMTGEGLFLYGFLQERADYMGERSEFEQAIADYARLMALSAETETLWNLTRLYIIIGQPQAALDMALLHLDLEPENPRFWAALAYIASRAGDTEQATQWLEQSRTIEADNASASYVAALVAAQLGDYETALSLLQSLEAVETWQYDYPFLNQYIGHSVSLDMARVYRQMGDTEQALLYYATLPYNVYVFLERGDYYVELGRTEDARLDFMQAEGMAGDSDLRSEIRQRIIALGPAPSATPSN